MKKYFSTRLFYSLFLLIIFVAIFVTCKKGDDSGSSIPTKPSATTSTANWLGERWATLKATVNANNDSTAVSFEYGSTTAYGLSIDATPDTVVGNVGVATRAGVTGLRPNTVYHFRVKAENSYGTVYGVDFTLTTRDSVRTPVSFNPDLTYGTVNDDDGNVYKTIEIGSQTWMAENLRAEKYNDGESIPFVADATDWGLLSTPGMCYYNSDSVSYGGIYNWYSVNTGKLCPTGWHVPSDEEWTILTDYLGGPNTAGDKLKETGTSHWIGTSSTVSNESGFTAIPGGFRTHLGIFNNIKVYSFLWSSTESTTPDAYCRDLISSYGNSDRGSSNKRTGLNVRCVKD